MRFSVNDFISESLKIEGIHRTPHVGEIEEFNRFMGLSTITINELIAFVNVYQPGSELRLGSRMNVTIGGIPVTNGGEAVGYMLDHILSKTNHRRLYKEAYQTHLEYEELHPFTDCNGRSGRMLWAWQVGEKNALDLGFLHRFYYDTFRAQHE